ncbi:MAG: Uma2 family endonuclease [candidate division KSB1 bacterium]|nr:Uma2 family endonuclease [candidate division KSB1 bacterium]MDZ7400132.1 Uma2 family endonuclease [candidate division KSB1 bacterium]
MEQLAEKKYYSPEEYLALEETAEYKSEYYRGEIFALAGTSVNHNQIIVNTVSKLSNRLDEKCRAFTTDVRLWIDEKDLFTYPDIMIVCGKIEFYPGRDDTITNPLVIIEVLSESTKNYDRGEKFVFYRAIPSFKEYILIDQYTVHVEHFYIGEQGKWVLTEYDNPDDILKFTKIDFQISLREIYHRVELPTSSSS